MSDVPFRKFHVEIEIYGEGVGYAIIELHPKVIEAVDDSWREMLYNLNTPEEIAEHIAYNMIENRAKLSQLDGWADLPNSYANILEWPDIVFDYKARELPQRDMRM